MTQDRMIELAEFLELSASEQLKYMQRNSEIMLSLIWWLAGYSGLAFRAQEALKKLRG